MTVTIDPLLDDTGLLIEDRIEQRQCRVLTPEPVIPGKANKENFLYPLDKAVRIESSELTLSQQPTAYFRDNDGDLVDHVEHFTERELPGGEYILEVPGPVKLYFRFDGPVSVSVDAVQMTITFQESQDVLVGVRSYHEKPAATITTTSKPTDVMRSISYLSSALKTMSPERSYPTLRGHPPELKVGDELQIPERLDRPDSEVRIEVPEELVPAMVVAPLGYYLGAEVVQGNSARIVVDSGFEHPLEGPFELEDEVEQVLKKVFFMDCLVRTDGSYGIPLQEREILEPKLDFNIPELYNAPTSEQLKAYLSVPFETISDYIPQWKLTAHVTPSDESIEILPFLVNDLAVIRTPASTTANVAGEEVAAINEFVRGRPGISHRSSDRAGHESIPSFVEPERTDSLEQAWVGDDVPVGASKAMVEAFRNRLDRDENTGDIDIVVVCNDSEMLDEHNTASEVYGSRDELPFDVRLYDDLTTDRLNFVLESDIDYFHYIGHIDKGGFECTDGMLDASELDVVGIDTFFLNACQSYHQGVELIRKGAIGGVVTLDEVINSGAVRVGKTMTRLLNHGFPIRGALNIARDRSIVGSQYIVVGDGNADVAQGTSLAPNLIRITRKNEGTFEVDHRTFYSSFMNLGSFVRPEIRGNDNHYLTGSTQTKFSVDQDELEEFLRLEIVPVETDSGFSWSDQINIENF
jgi:hypothetical protein